MGRGRVFTAGFGELMIRSTGRPEQIMICPVPLANDSITRGTHFVHTLPGYLAHVPNR